MSLVLPNSFTCTSRTALLDTIAPTDFRPLAQHGLPHAVAGQLAHVSRLLVTRSRVRSSVCSDRYIDFTETLVKIPVRLHSQDYLFPVVTYVDHEYSLVRGYLLGFHKLFAVGGPNEAFPAVTLPGFDLDLGDQGTAAGDDNDLPDEQALPFLLWTDYSVAEARSHGWRTLVIDRYERTGLTFLHPLREKQVIRGAKATVRSLYEIADRFVVTGTQPLEGG